MGAAIPIHRLTIRFIKLKTIIATGTGRCGTHFLHEVFAHSKYVLSKHVPFPEADSFFRYCEWYGINIDKAAFIKSRKDLMQGDITKAAYFEANPYLAHSIPFLHKELNAKMVFVYRDPFEVVASHYVKGWYLKSPEKSDTDKLPYLCPDQHITFGFGRIMPLGFEYERWKRLTRIGKIAWMYNVVNNEILDAIETIDPADTFRININDFDYAEYEKLCGFMGVDPELSEKKLARLRKKKPGKGPKRLKLSEIPTLEMDEFLTETELIRQRMQL